MPDDPVDEEINKMLAGGGGGDDGVKLQLTLMREDRKAAEAREERAAAARREWFQTLVTLVGPVILKMFDRPDPLAHPLIAQLITNAGGGEQAKKMQDAMASTLRESSKLQMETMAAAMQSASTMKDQLNEKMMESALERIERLRDEDGDDDRGPLGGAQDLLELMRGAKELLAPAPATAAPPALPGPGSRPPVDQVDEPEGVDDVDQVDEPEAAAPPARRKSNPLRLTLRAIRGYYRGDIPEAEVKEFLTRLVKCASDATAFKAAIVAGDEAAVLELVTPEISASAELAAWVSEPGVLDWLRQFAAEVLRPALSAPIAAAKPASRPPVRRVAARAAASPRARRHVVLADDPLV